jgi:hypothetical protein
VSDPAEAAMKEALHCRRTLRSTAKVVGNGQEPAAVVFAVGDALGDALVRPGRVAARIVLPRRQPAAPGQQRRRRYGKDLSPALARHKPRQRKRRSVSRSSIRAAQALIGLTLHVRFNVADFPDEAGPVRGPGKPEVLVKECGALVDRVDDDVAPSSLLARRHGAR